MLRVYVLTMDGSSVKQETPSPTDSTRQQLLPYRQYPAAHMSRPGCTACQKPVSASEANHGVRRLQLAYATQHDCSGSVSVRVSTVMMTCAALLSVLPYAGSSKC